MANGDPLAPDHTQTNDAANHKHVGNTKPILSHVIGEDALTKYKLYCNVLSVCYFDGKPGNWNADERGQACAVLFEVTFDLEDRILLRARIPTSVVATAIDVSTFPDPNESIKMSDRIVNDTMTLSPNFQALGATANIGTLSRQEQKNTPEFLHLEKYTVCSGKGVDIQWKFINDGSKYFPSTIRLLVVATKIATSSPFQFKLRILPTLKVCLRPSGWRQWPRKLAPADGHHGWDFSIETDHYPQRAKKAFDECQTAKEEGGFSKEVGLRPAVYSYFKDAKGR